MTDPSRLIIHSPEFNEPVFSNSIQIGLKPSLRSEEKALNVLRFQHLLPRGVMVTQEILILSFKVRILAG